MKKLFCTSGVLLSLALCAVAPAHAVAIFVEAGSTYLLTQPGQLVTGGPFAGTIFDPTPIDHGANLVVSRPADIEINGAPGVIKLTAAALHSRAPVDIGGNFFDVFVDLDPAHLSDDVGTLKITGDLSGGTAFEVFTYYARLTLYFAGTLNPGPLSPQVIKITSVSEVFAWTPTPPAGAVIINGSAGDPLANVHTGLGVNETDFFPSAAFQATGTGPNGGSTTTTASPIVLAAPEPGSFLLVGLGLAALRFGRRTRG